MENLGTFIAGSIFGAVSLGALAWKFGDNSVSDKELDNIISYTEKSIKRNEEIQQELEQIGKQFEAVDIDSPDCLNIFKKLGKRQNKLINELLSF